jgi:hypothetical protein
MQELREALLGLGIDLPELIGRLLRESSAFVREVEAQLAQLPSGDVLIQQFRKVARTVFQSNRALIALFVKRGFTNLHKQLMDLGLSTEQVDEIVKMLTYGLLQFFAEQAALGKSLEEAIDAAKQLPQPTRWERMMASLAGLVQRMRSWLSRMFTPIANWLRRPLFTITIPTWLVNTAAAIRNLFSNIGTALSGLLKPLGALASLPQLAIGADIFKRIKLAGAWQRLGRMLAIGFRMWIAGALLALLTDAIPIEDIGRMLGLSERRILQVKGILSFFKRFLFGMIPRTIYGIIDLILIAPIKGLLRGDFFGAIKSAWRNLVDYWKSQWDAWHAEQELAKREMKATIEGATSALSEAFADIHDTIASQTIQLAGLRNQVAGKLSELRSILGAARAEGPMVAPPGIGREWDQIGELAVFYRSSLEDLYINLEQFNKVSNRLQAILALSETMRIPAAEIADAAKELRDLSLSAWETVYRPDRPWVRVTPELEAQLFRIGPSVNAILSSFRKIRDQLQALPPEQRVAFHSVIQWLNQAIAAGQEFGNVLDAVFKAPTTYREKFLEAMQKLASIMNADQLKASVFDPIREQLRDLNERLTEMHRRAIELLDPREVRERLLALARAQYEALTAPFRALAEAQQAWSDFMSDLTGDLTREAIDAANNLSAAFMNVLEMLGRPALRPKEALEKLADAFELVGEDVKNIRVHIERLQQLLTSENFMATTPEALAAVRSELAKLGREVLEQLGRIRQLREEISKLRFEAMEDAIESVIDSYDSLRFAVDRALEAESRYHQTVMQEARLRYLMMVRLGVHPIIAQQRAWDWAWQQLRRRPLAMPAALENLQSLTSSLADQFEELGDAYSAIVARSQVAGLAMQRYARYTTTAMQIVAGTGQLVQQAVTYMQRGFELFTQALRFSLDLRVAIAGVGAAFKELRDIFSELGTEYLSDLVSRVRLLPIVLATGFDRLRQLFTQRLLLSFLRGWDAFIARLKTEREIMNVWRTLLPEPEDLADHFRDLADTIGSWIERGHLPSFVAMSMDQARAQFLDLLNWLRQFYLGKLQQLGELMSFVPFGTKVWLELLQAQLQVAKSLDDIEQKLRNIRMELVSLSLYAIPERLSQFLITEGPALWAFMRTGALGGVSTLNFTIHVTAQDVSVGIQQALQQAQRTLAGFTYRTIF